jgi:Family of unknown function (DUF695)
MIVRWNSGYRKFGSVAGYRDQVGIAVPLRMPELTGLPSPEEDADLQAIEDAIYHSFQEHAESLFVAVITTSGMREFVLYTRAPEHARQCFEHLRTIVTSHELQLMIQPDEAWAVYSQLI